MSTDAREERLAGRIAHLYATDQQFADSQPSDAVSAAADEPGLRLAQIVQTVVQGYAERPALGQRAIRLVDDPQTGRTTAMLLPHFETVTYGELWDRVERFADALRGAPVKVGDRVAILG